MSLLLNVPMQALAEGKTLNEYRLEEQITENQSESDKDYSETELKTTYEVNSVLDSDIESEMLSETLVETEEFSRNETDLKSESDTEHITEESSEIPNVQEENKADTQEEFTYKIDSVKGYVTITGYNGNFGDVLIPNEIKGYTVTVIGGSAFKNNNIVQNIVLPNSIQKIETEAFYGCKNLKNIVLANGLQDIQSNAFAWCESLDNIVMPNTVINVGKEAFIGCKTLENLSLSNKLSVIKENTFKENKNLKKVVLPSSITIIEDGAFCNSGIEDINLPDGLKAINGTANTSGVSGPFYGTKLNGIIIPASVNHLGGCIFQKSTLPYAVIYGNPEIRYFDAWSSSFFPFDSHTDLYGISTSIIYSYAVAAGNSFYKIDAPSNLQARKASKSSITVSWNRINNVEGYELFRSTSKNGSYDLIATLNDSTYTDNNLSPGQEYFYKVRLYYNRDNTTKIDGVFSQSVACSLKPQNITTFSALPINQSNIDLKWGQVKDVDGYEIFRSTSLNGNFALIKSITGGKNVSYRDTVNWGNTYYYKIRSYVIGNGVKISSTDSLVRSATTTKSISGVKVATITNQIYNGKNLTPQPVVKDGSITLKENIDYTLTYKNNKNIGKGTIILSGKNRYIGTKDLSFFINPQKTSGLKNTSSKVKQAKLTWDKDLSVTGYQIVKYDDKSKKYKNIQTISTYKTTTYTDKKVNSGKSYKYKVRSYKKINNDIFYGSYSDVLAVTPTVQKSLINLKNGKTYKSYDVTGNGKKDKLLISERITKDFNDHSGYLRIKINGKEALNLKEIKKGDKTWKYKVKLCTLDGKGIFFDIATVGLTGYQEFHRMYQYKKGKLRQVADINTMYKKGGVRRLETNVIKVDNNKIIISAHGQLYATGTLDWTMTYKYKTGKLSLESKKFPTNYKKAHHSNKWTLNQQLYTYLTPGKSKRFWKIGKGYQVSIDQICIYKKGIYINLVDKYGVSGELGWVINPSQSASESYFNEALFAG